MVGFGPYGSKTIATTQNLTEAQEKLDSIATINIHEKCLSLIEKMNSKILFENPTRGGLGDGLIVAKN